MKERRNAILEMTRHWREPGDWLMMNSWSSPSETVPRTGILNQCQKIDISSHLNLRRVHGPIHSVHRTRLPKSKIWLGVFKNRLYLLTNNHTSYEHCTIHIIHTYCGGPAIDAELRNWKYLPPLSLKPRRFRGFFMDLIHKWKLTTDWIEFIRTIGRDHPSCY